MSEYGEMNLYGPNPNDKEPMKGFPQVGYLKNYIKSSNIEVEGLEKALVRKSLLENFNVSLKDSYDEVHDEIFDKIIEAETA